MRNDLVKRLRCYNPPDRVIDDQRQIAVDISEAADRIEALESLVSGGNCIRKDGESWRNTPQKRNYKMAKFDSIRKDSFVGMTHVNDDPNTGVHFSEWWSGEGLDITIHRKSQPDIMIGLHLDEIAAVVTAALATRMVDLEECENRANEMLGKIENEHPSKFSRG